MSSMFTKKKDRRFNVEAFRCLWLAVGLLVAGCGYSFRSPVPSHLNTVYVATFDNETREFQLTQQLTERVINEFLGRSRLQLVSDEDEAHASRGAEDRHRAAR